MITCHMLYRFFYFSFTMYFPTTSIFLSILLSTLDVFYFTCCPPDDQFGCFYAAMNVFKACQLNTLLLGRFNFFSIQIPVVGLPCQNLAVPTFFFLAILVNHGFNMNWSTFHIFWLSVWYLLAWRVSIILFPVFFEMVHLL